MSSKETTAKRVPCTLESVVLRLRSLKRYDVGSGDDGDGYMYDYHDEDNNGDWISASDIDGIIQWIEQNNQAPQRAASAVAACSDSTNSANPETNNAKGKT